MSSTSTPESTCTGIGCNCYPNGHCGPPPPTATYPDYNTGFEAIQAHARLNGYAVYIRDKQPPKQPPNRVTVCCDKGPEGYQDKGKRPDVHETKRRKNTGSKKCGCKFRVEIKLQEPKLPGESPVWQVRDIGKAHNHGRSADISAHPQHRLAACSEETKDLIIAAAKSGQRYPDILAMHQETTPAFNLVSKDISNLLQGVRNEELAGRSPIQWLLKVSVYLIIYKPKLTVYRNSKRKGLSLSITRI